MMSCSAPRAVHLAIVLDAELKTAGIVSFEDVLEEIVGDIRDEFDLGRGRCSSTTDITIVVSGLFTMRELQAETGWALNGNPRNRSAWASATAVKALRRGEAFLIGDYRVTAIEIVGGPGPEDSRSSGRQRNTA